MSELIDRYVHQVGLYVRPKERAEIESELRSQIQDQLEDRYGSAFTQVEVAAILKQMGDPRTIAASYGGEQYLIGPDLYPFFITVLRFGLPLVPSVVVIANFVGAAVSPTGSDWISLLLGSIFTALQAALIFVAVVVGIFAVLQHSGEEFRTKAESDFNPLELPAVNDPGIVDRFESGVGIAIGLLIAVALFYYLQVGGLTLRFNLNDPGDVLPVSMGWLAALLATTLGSVSVNLWALIRRRWNLWTWLAQSLFDLLGALSLYFVLYTPLLERAQQTVPSLSDLPLETLPWTITLVMIVLIVLVNGFKLMRIWQQQQEKVR